MCWAAALRLLEVLHGSRQLKPAEQQTLEPVILQGAELLNTLNSSAHLFTSCRPALKCSSAVQMLC